MKKHAKKEKGVMVYDGVSTHAIVEAAGLCPREVRGFRILIQHVPYLILRVMKRFKR